MTEDNRLYSNFHLNTLRKKIRPHLLTALGHRNLMASIDFMFSHKKIPDDVIKLIVKDVRSNPTAVAYFSTPEAPEMVHKAITGAKNAKEILGHELGVVIIDPIYQGKIDGQSCAILPYYKPISNWRPIGYLQRYMLKSSILSWLRNVVKKTAAKVENNNIDHDFIRPLQYMADLKIIGEEIRNESKRAIKRLELGQWEPCHVLMHDDFWLGNILLKKRAIWKKSTRENYPFIVIDWPGSLLKGFAVYDLVRMAESMNLNYKLFKGELRKHSIVLKCDMEDTRGYLMAALGNIGLNIGHFPTENYVRLIKQCYEYFQSGVEI